MNFGKGQRVEKLITHRTVNLIFLMRPPYKQSDSRIKNKDYR
jgi:hypothetical protein